MRRRAIRPGARARGLGSLFVAVYNFTCVPPFNTLRDRGGRERAQRAFRSLPKRRGFCFVSLNGRVKLVSEFPRFLPLYYLALGIWGGHRGDVLWDALRRRRVSRGLSGTEGISPTDSVPLSLFMRFVLHRAGGLCQPFRFFGLAFALLAALPQAFAAIPSRGCKTIPFHFLM